MKNNIKINIHRMITKIISYLTIGHKACIGVVIVEAEME